MTLGLKCILLHINKMSWMQYIFNPGGHSPPPEQHILLFVITRRAESSIHLSPGGHPHPLNNWNFNFTQKWLRSPPLNHIFYYLRLVSLRRRGDIIIRQWNMWKTHLSSLQTLQPSFLVSLWCPQLDSWHQFGHMKGHEQFRDIPIKKAHLCFLTIFLRQLKVEWYRMGYWE